MTSFGYLSYIYIPMSIMQAFEHPRLPEISSHLDLSVSVVFQCWFSTLSDRTRILVRRWLLSGYLVEALHHQQLLSGYLVEAVHHRSSLLEHRKVVAEAGSEVRDYAAVAVLVT